MNRTLTLAGITCLVFSFAAGCGQSTHNYVIQFKYTPGSSFQYLQVAKGTVASKEGDSVVSSRYNTVNTDIEFTVRRVVDDTTWEIAQKMTSHHHSVNQLDSSVTDTSESAPEISMYIAPSGRVVDFEYANSSAGSKADYWKEYFRQGTPVFPSEPVTLGHTWTQSYDVKINSSSVQVSTAYAIKGVENRQGYDCIAISYVGKLIIPFDAMPEDSLRRRGVDRIADEGVMYHAIKEGFTVSQQEKWTLDSDRSKLREGKEVPYTVHIEYEVNYDLKSVKKP